MNNLMTTEKLIDALSFLELRQKQRTPHTVEGYLLIRRVQQLEVEWAEWLCESYVPVVIDSWRMFAFYDAWRKSSVQGKFRTLEGYRLAEDEFIANINYSKRNSAYYDCQATRLYSKVGGDWARLVEFLNWDIFPPLVSREQS